MFALLLLPNYFHQLLYLGHLNDRNCLKYALLQTDESSISSQGWRYFILSTKAFSGSESVCVCAFSQTCFRCIAMTHFQKCIHDKENKRIFFSRWPYNLHTNALITLHFDDSFYIIRNSLLISDYNALFTIILTYLNQSVFFIIASLAEAGYLCRDWSHAIRCYW